MKRLASLIKLSLNVNFGISYMNFKYIKRRRFPWEPFVIFLSLGSLAGMLSFGLYKGTLYFYDQTAALGQPGTILTLTALFAQIIVLVFGVGFILSTFYYSSDIPTLIPLPIKPYEAMAAKFITLLVNEYITVFFILMPVWVAYSVKAGAGILFWLSAVPVFLMIPVIPLAISAILIVILMRFVNLSRKKDLLTILGGSFIVLISIGFQIYAQTFLSQMSEEDLLRRIMSSAHGISTLVSRQFPPSLWAARALAESGSLSGLSYLLLFVGISAAAFLLLLILGNIAFYRSIQSGIEAGGGGRGRKSSAAAGGNGWIDYLKQRNSIVALSLAETRLLIRTPVYALNCFVGFIIFPVIVAASMILGSAGGDLTELLFSLASVSDARYIGILTGVGYFLVGASFSAIPSTAFSREGMRMAIIKSLPISGEKLIYGKLLAAQIILTIGVIPGAAVIANIFKLGISELAMMLIFGTLVSFFFNITALIIDLVRPMLEWNDPQRPIKQNLNTVFGMLSGVLLIGLSVLFIRLLFGIGAEYGLVMILLGLLFLAADYGAVRYVKVNAGKILKRLEI